MAAATARLVNKAKHAKEQIMTTLLAIETSTECCSVALMHQQHVHERRVEGSKRHAESVLVFIDELLNEHSISKKQLQAVAFGRGPGAFTGVRLAVALAQGFGFGLDIPALPVSTLAATAFDAFTRFPELRSRPLLVALDARMGEVYVGQYQFDEGRIQAIIDERLCKPEAISSSDAAYSVGSGVLAHPNHFTCEIAQQVQAQPRASAIAQLAQFVIPVRAEHALPVYLRDQVALSIRERLAAGMAVMQPL
jgi:tRNA threonylcarbamoyladenosine biosynthesis protein TsaB